MFRKLSLTFLALLVCLFAFALAEEAAVPRPDAVLPALPTSPAWYGAGSGVAPAVRSTDDDGNVLRTYHNVSAEDYAAYSRTLAQAGFTLTTRLYNGSSVLASLTDGETPLRVQYDLVMCELTVTLPETSFLRAWASPAALSDFWGEWAMDWYWEDEEFSQEEEYAPHLFLSEEACYSYDESFAVSFDGRLLTLNSERYGYEYVLFFDVSGMLQMCIPGEEAAANLKPVISPFWLLGTWEVVEMVRNGEVVEQAENWALRCASEGVYELLDGAVFSGPYPWVNAWSGNGTFDVEGIRYALKWTEGDRLIMNASVHGNTVQFTMESRVDISELLGAWRFTAYIEDGVEVPADPEVEEVLLIEEDGIVMYDDGELRNDLTWQVLGTWPGSATMVSSYVYNGDNYLDAGYQFALGEDGRLYNQVENAGFVMTRDPDFQPVAVAEPEAPAEEPVQLLTATAQGLLSDVTVTLTLHEDGAIASIAVDASGETEIIARPCTEEAFLSQFIGRVGPFDDIDMVTGATFTSKAVIEAVNSLFPAAEDNAPADEVPGNLLTATARGLLSDVTVTLTLHEDGAIASITVDASGETEIIARPCTEEAFLSQFIGRVGPFDDIDVVAGATWTSNAVIEAVNSLFPEE